jgi:acylphosphatase
MAEELVLTPGGYRPKSLVQHVEPGHVLRMSETGNLQKVDRVGKVVADFGKLGRRAAAAEEEPLMPKNVYVPAAPKAAGKVPALGQGWISYAYWNNNTGNALTSFATTWVVPPEPATQSGQTIFLFNGIQNGSMIYQPVLQFGSSYAGGGNYWTVASWYADGQGGPAFFSQLTRVNPGQVLVGIMTLTGSGVSGFDYDCQFEGLANSNLPIQNVAQLSWCAETLETYNVQKCSDYPATQQTAFRAISIQTGGIRPAVAWTGVSAVHDCGQKCVVISNSASNGEVDIQYGTSAAIVLGGVASVGNNADGRLEVFANGTDHAMWHRWQTTPNGNWSDWASLGGLLTTDAAVARNRDGRLEIFARGADDALWHIWQTAPNGNWSTWNSLGGSLTSDPSVDHNQDGRLEVFARGADNALWHNWQTAPNGGWSGWHSLGGVITSDPEVYHDADGRLEVFARGTDGAVRHIWQTAPNGGWSAWASLGGVVTSLCGVTQNADGRLEVFARGTNNALWHLWQTAPNGGWSGWYSLGGVITSDPVVTRNRDGRLEVFARGTDDAAWHIWQTAPNGGWSGWSSLGGVLTSDMDAAQNADGRLEIFARGTDDALWHIWQTAPNNGWSGWSSLGGVLTADLQAVA